MEIGYEIPMKTRILFVCLGNICRSPSAEGVLRAIATKDAPDLELTIDSAGTSDWHVGAPPYSPMQVAARARGIELANLRARQLNSADFGRFDLIIGMDTDNIAKIEHLRPSKNAVPVRLFTDYIPQSDPHYGMDHVPDPYYTRDFNQTLDLIDAASRGLVAELQAAELQHPSQ